MMSHCQCEDVIIFHILSDVMIPFLVNELKVSETFPGNSGSEKCCEVKIFCQFNIYFIY